MTNWEIFKDVAPMLIGIAASVIGFGFLCIAILDGAKVLQ